MIDLIQYPYKLKNIEDMNVTIQSIRNDISTVKHCRTTVNHISFDDNVSKFDDYEFNPIISTKSFDELCNDKIDNIKYFDDTGALYIPSIIDKTLEDNKKSSYDMNISYYNLQPNNKWGYETIEELPTLFKPTSFAKYTTIEKTYHPNTVTNTYILYENLPQDLYANVIIDVQSIMFDIDESVYYSKKYNQEEILKLFDDVVNKGFEYPLEMAINSDGSLLPIDSQVEFLIAKYLNLPSIPVAFISSNSIDKHYIAKHQATPNKEELEKIFQPYLMI